jgi:mRNA interferase MazF
MLWIAVMSGLIWMEMILKVNVGDIVNINLNPTKGDEKSKVRPCIVIQNQITPLRLVTVLPITEDTGRRNNAFFVSIGDYHEVGLKKPSVVDCYQIRTVSMDRLSEEILGNASELMDDIKKRLANILEITEEHIE